MYITKQAKCYLYKVNLYILTMVLKREEYVSLNILTHMVLDNVSYLFIFN